LRRDGGNFLLAHATGIVHPRPKACPLAGTPATTP
jgi:hypothetical protein